MPDKYTKALLYAEEIQRLHLIENNITEKAYLSRLDKKYKAFIKKNRISKTQKIIELLMGIKHHKIKEQKSIIEHFNDITPYTKYQCKLEQAKFEYWLQKLEKIIEESCRNIDVSEFDFPKGYCLSPQMVSSFTGNFISESIIGDDTSTAILVNAEFYESGANICALMPNYIFEGAPIFSGGRYRLENLLQNLQANQAWLASLNHHVLKLVNYEPGFFDKDLFPISFDPKNLLNKDYLTRREYFFEGFMYMLLGHEWFHIFMNHAEIERDTFRILRDTPNLDQAITKWRVKYKDVLNLPTEDDMSKLFLTAHSKEFCADYCIFEILINRWSEDPGNEELFCNALGAILCLVLIDRIEKSIRLIKGGTEFAFCELWNTDTPTDDLCLRKTHPGPKSRIEALLVTAARSGGYPNAENSANLTHVLLTIYSNMQCHWLYWADVICSTYDVTKLTVNKKWENYLHHDSPVGKKVDIHEFPEYF